MSKKAAHHKDESHEEEVHEKPVEKAVRSKKVSVELVLPVKINGIEYSGTVTTDDHGLAEVLVEMHEKARAARLQEQTGRVSEILKIGGRLVIKEVK
jgi:hypothetical protein